jgi:hypothetical protein
MRLLKVLILFVFYIFSLQNKSYLVIQNHTGETLHWLIGQLCEYYTDYSTMNQKFEEDPFPLSYHTCDYGINDKRNKIELQPNCFQHKINEDEDSVTFIYLQEKGVFQDNRDFSYMTTLVQNEWEGHKPPVNQNGRFQYDFKCLPLSINVDVTASDKMKLNLELIFQHFNFEMGFIMRETSQNGIQKKGNKRKYLLDPV